MQTPRAVNTFLILLQVAFHGCSSSDTLPPPTLPLFNITASSLRQAGRKHGRIAASRIKGWMQSEEMTKLIAYARGPGRTAFEELKQNNTKWFPQYVEEIKGISEGAGIDLDDVWVLNLINALEALMNANIEGHCSDFFAVDNGTFSHGHNEDWGGPVKSWAYFVKYKAAADADFENCAGFIYPGSVIGWAATWNSYGMYLTQNSLFPKDNRPRGVASIFAQRDAMCGETASMTQDAMIERVASHVWSSGASINFVDVTTGEMANVEVHEGQHSVYRVSKGTSTRANYSHFNMYKHLEPGKLDRPEESESTIRRQARSDALPAVRNTQDVIDRLSDVADPKIPIYRDITLTTMVYDGTTGRMNVWCCGHSAASGPPLYSWDMLHFFDDKFDVEIIV